jgi:hypothetical protein
MLILTCRPYVEQLLGAQRWERIYDAGVEVKRKRRKLRQLALWKDKGCALECFWRGCM